jgi:hypothetical protein
MPRASDTITSAPTAMRPLLSRSRGLRTLVSIVVLAASACAGSNRGAGIGSLRGRGAVVEVRNDEFDDLVVYLIRSGTPIPLGVVSGNARRAFGLQDAELGGGASIALGVAKRGEPILRWTAAFELPPGRIATWVVRSGNRLEQPVVRE